MIVKHECSNLITTPKREHFYDFLIQAINVIAKSKETLEIISEVDSDDYDPFEEIEALEGQTYDDVQGISSFASGGISSNPSITIGVRDAITHINKFNTIITEYIDCGLFLDDEQHEILQIYCERIISELAYAIWFEFNVSNHLDTINSDDAYLDEIIKMYVDSLQVDLESFLENIKNTREQYHFHLSVFDDAPELEAEFEAIMGPYMGSLAEVDLTLPLVKKVINGKLSPIELIEELTMQTVDMDVF